MFHKNSALVILITSIVCRISWIFATETVFMPCGHDVFKITNINAVENKWTGVLDVARYDLIELSVEVKFEQTANTVLIERSRGVGSSSPGKTFHGWYYRPIDGFKKESFIVHGHKGQGFPNILSLTINGNEICPHPFKLHYVKNNDTTPEPSPIMSSYSSALSNFSGHLNRESHYGRGRRLVSGGESDTVKLSHNTLNTSTNSNELEVTESTNHGFTSQVQTQTRNETCGKRLVQYQSLILNGVPSREGDWPWHAGVYHIGLSFTTSYKCGGTLIAANSILTAAHCIMESGRPLIPSRIIVKLGMLDRLISSRNSQEFRVFKVYPHENFSDADLRNDIALLRLATEVEYNNFIQPACLFNSDDQEENSVIGKVGTVIGWGLTKQGLLADVLTQAMMPVVSLATCLDSNRDFFGLFLSDKNFCAGYRNGTSVCNGDSGSGMFFERDGIFFIRGIVSLSVSLEDKDVCDPDHYAVFTDVAKYIPWIRDLID